MEYSCIFISLASSCIYGLLVALLLILIKKPLKTAIYLTAISTILNISLCYAGLLFDDNVSNLYEADRFDFIKIGADSSSIKKLLGEPVRRRVKDWQKENAHTHTTDGDSLLWEFRVEATDDITPDLILFALTGIYKLHSRPCEKSFVLISRSTGKVLRKGGFCDLPEG